jgi:sulfate adenylyltransferase
MLNLLPLAMRMAGPREALWHAIIRQNYGCSHFIVGRDHASPGKDSQGNLFYGYYDAQTLLAEHQNELAIKIVSFKEMVYVKERMQYAAIDEVQKNETVMNISGTELRERLHTGGEIPTWFTYAEIIEELRCSYPARLQQGFTLFFTGLSAAGKSTIAKALLARLMALGGRQVTLLDGDEVRRILSSGLGFSRQDRDLNIVRIGYLAAEITKHRGIAICAAIAPYRAAREEVRRMVSSHGGFIEIYVSTPLEICEKRDPKGLYVKARNNFLPGFTGISDPYEMPEHSEIALNTRDISVDEATDIIISKLTALGYLKSNELLQETVNTINE